MLSRTVQVAAVLQLAACTCGEPEGLTGAVVDIWGNPAPGVEVTFDDKSNTTNDKGMFRFQPKPSGEVTLAVAGEGYISKEVTFEVAKREGDFSQNVAVYPEPADDGFHLVGEDAYVRLPGQAVVRQGNDLKAFQGVKSVGDVEVSGGDVELVFHTPLKMDQVARLDIELHRLEFVEKTSVATVDGEEQIDLNLWVSAKKVEVERTTLGSDDNYLYSAKGLPSGSYAFVSMHLLDAIEGAAFDKVPAELRRVHAFTVE